MVHGGAQDRFERDPLGARSAGQLVEERAALAMELLQGERDDGGPAAAAPPR